MFGFGKRRKEILERGRELVNQTVEERRKQRQTKAAKLLLIQEGYCLRHRVLKESNGTGRPPLLSELSC